MVTVSLWAVKRPGYFWLYDLHSLSDRMSPLEKGRCTAAVTMKASELPMYALAVSTESPYLPARRSASLAGTTSPSLCIAPSGTDFRVKAVSTLRASSPYSVL
ncbi:MAG: hypothetical protein BWY99_01204 [Synergistetes bacterium ADurb.BinA166]|nr:MAG: hypothetical protein BWY99_01204 [Synergistetes bacterium ADurb.BinA166]